jgi:hypothetical protein
MKTHRQLARALRASVRSHEIEYRAAVPYTMAKLPPLALVRKADRRVTEGKVGQVQPQHQGTVDGTRL